MSEPVAALAVLDPRQASVEIIATRLSFLADRLDEITDEDELNQLDAWLRAVAARLKQLNSESAEAERLRIRTFNRLGELLGPVTIFNPKRNNQHGATSEDSDVAASLPQSERDRRWQARTIHEHWPVLEPMLLTMKKPSISAVLNVIKRAAQAEASHVPLPNGDKLYPVLYADPPWRYQFSETRSRQIENHYPTMPHEEIAKMEFPAADDAVLFMWATNPKLAEAFVVLAGWGFEYVTNMVWVKNHIGMGYFARSRHELLLIARRGSLPVPEPANRPDSVIEAPRLEHSAKPPIVYDLIERMYPGFAKLELFARSEREGWDVWGNEVTGQ
jgi:N6-adenosine-specific RNA methylase IME4